MLSESFIASVQSSTTNKSSSSTPSSLRDVGITIHEYQPAPALRTSFKKSSTAPNCLAVSASHIFAAQTDKAVVNVYNRKKGNQEATVPFPERVRSVAVSSGGEVLVLGTEGGRLILWEICTGRSVSSSASHLHPVTSLVVDPTDNFILSGSKDANVHVWSLPGLLSFSQPSSLGQNQPLSNSPVRTFSNHRAGITALAVGHSRSRSNIAISASQDNTAAVWDYHTGSLLHTFLLPSTPLSLVVDPADRAFYTGYEDGSVQLVDFFKSHSIQNSIHDTSLQSTPSQLSASERWTPPSPDSGAADCLTLSYDGTTLLSGHRNGAVLSWDIPRGRYSSSITEYPHPVTNIHMLPPNGLPPSKESRVTIQNIVKPRHDLISQSNGTIPANYTLNYHITSSSPLSTISSTKSPQPLVDDFTTALTHPFFPQDLISEGLAELATFNSSPQSQEPNTVTTITSQPDPDLSSEISTLKSQLSTLSQKLSTTEAARHASTSEIVKLRETIASLQGYNSELRDKQVRAEEERVERRARREERGKVRREKWFEAERRGESGDKVVGEMEEGSEDEDDQGMSSDD
ncbi:Pre-rRNA-processing protein ipi3 [Arachnomyces sp. PD_36]|nr:Pre-rRNA-processing protein ipi3 [Arachnomyces sp. PD_36]